MGALFLAVQLLDILFAIFVLLGVEKLRIVPGFTAFNPYDLYWMPYSHSLLAALIWSALTTLVALAALRHLRSRDKRIAAGLLGAAVFSHFLLDLPMHTPDLPLGLDAASPKIGLGLWNHPGALARGGASRARRGSRDLPAGHASAEAAPRPSERGYSRAFSSRSRWRRRSFRSRRATAPSRVQASLLYGLLGGRREWIDRGRAPRLTAVPQLGGARIRG